jgi:hypothetical protein
VRVKDDKEMAYCRLQLVVCWGQIEFVRPAKLELEHMMPVLQQTEVSLINKSIPDKHWKVEDGRKKQSKIEVYIFGSLYLSFEILHSYRISSSRKLFPIEGLFSTRRTHFDISGFIKVSSTQREIIYLESTSGF